jgi:signal recognition particle subunit SRP54
MILTKLRDLFSTLAGKKTLTEENLADAVRQVRLALLDADVNYGVASAFVKKVKEKATGQEVLKSLTPGQQFIKVVHDELIELMGKEEAPLSLAEYPSVILLCGLQGSGKTTSCAKLAAYLKKKEPKKKLLLAACDLQRPAAILQLQTLAAKIGVDCFALPGETKPLKVGKEALEKARKEGYDVLIVDTAGRLHLDEELMQELKEMKKWLAPQEILFVASASTGQDAVRTAQEFDQTLAITGSILTMLDGSSRAGAALSIAQVTQKPLKFEGIGEQIDDLQLFNPRSMADRILGMGDVINLARRAEEVIDKEESAKLEKKLRKASFTYEDYLRQMGMLKKMGPLKSLLKMLPGIPNLDEAELPEGEFGKIEALILSMTPDEREEKVELTPSRRRRIANGSGTTIDVVNRMVKDFKRLKLLCRAMPKNLKNLKDLDLKGMEKQLWQ